MKNDDFFNLPQKKICWPLQCSTTRFYLTIYVKKDVNRWNINSSAILCFCNVCKTLNGFGLIHDVYPPPKIQQKFNKNSTKFTEKKKRKSFTFFLNSVELFSAQVTSMGGRQHDLGHGVARKVGAYSYKCNYFFQRLSWCLSFLFLTMITSAMFYKTDENVERPLAIHIGPLVFSVHVSDLN